MARRPGRRPGGVQPSVTIAGRARVSERLTEAGALASVGSRGDSYDNALAESTIGILKTELVRPRGPFRGQDDLEIGMLEWVDW